jgi:hypothetical protein
MDRQPFSFRFPAQLPASMLKGKKEGDSLNFGIQSTTGEKLNVALTCKQDGYRYGSHRFKKDFSQSGEVWVFEGQHDWKIEDDYLIIDAPYQVSLYKKDGTVIEENVKLIKRGVAPPSIKEGLNYFKSFKKEAFKVFNLKLGYTQGELQESFEDFDDSFNALRHSYWKFTIVIDEYGSLDFVYLLIDWNKQECHKLSSDEEVAVVISEICNSSTEDMFGREITKESFESVVIGVLDQPIGYSCQETVLDAIGGSLEIIEESIKIPEEFVNSLYCLSEEFDSEIVSFEEDQILISKSKIDLNEKYKTIDKICHFTNDVMNQ